MIRRMNFPQTTEQKFHKSPNKMAVIIGVGQYAYQRQDGVYVIPIGCLKD